VKAAKIHPLLDLPHPLAQWIMGTVLSNYTGPPPARATVPRHMVSIYFRSRGLTGWLLLQVAAYTSGRLAVNKFDCLLLQHILWQRPDEAQRINDFLLDRLAADSSTQQTDYLFNGESCLQPF
jgi:hypothetical protein